MNTTIDRRNILKGLLGAPVALLAGGAILDNAATLEPYNDTALVVPKRDLVPAADSAIFHTALPDNSGVTVDFRYNFPVVLPEGEDFWIHVQNGPMAMVALHAFKQGERITVDLVATRPKDA